MRDWNSGIEGKEHTHVTVTVTDSTDQTGPVSTSACAQIAKQRVDVFHHGQTLLSESGTRLDMLTTRQDGLHVPDHTTTPS